MQLCRRCFSSALAGQRRRLRGRAHACRRRSCRLDDYLDEPRRPSSPQGNRATRRDVRAERRQRGRMGIGFFVFLMVLREGAELILILRAVELSIAGLQVWIGTGIGIAMAVAVGLFFFQGTLKIPLGRFFAATSTILMV